MDSSESVTMDFSESVLKKCSSKQPLVGDTSMIDYRKQELELVGERIEQHPNKYLIWDYRRTVVENIGPEVVGSELEFTNRILLSKGTTNIQAWSHREWIIRKFDANLWQPEIQYCHEIIDKDVFNVTAWNQICRAVMLNPNMKKESRDIEVAYAKKNIYAQPGNEGPWMYLKFLYMKENKSLYRDPNLECIYVDILAEEAERITFSVHLDPPRQCMMNYASLVDKRACLHALNLVMDLIILGYKASENTRLVKAINVLLKHLVWTYSSVNPDNFKCTSEFVRKIGALVLSLDAFRIRYCYMYRGYSLFMSLPDEDDDDEEEEEEHQQTSYDAMDKCDNLPLQSLEELFESWITSNGFVDLKPKWKRRLFQTYLQNRKRYDRTENEALEDLKWIARRCVLKRSCSNEAALSELQHTTNIIKDDAYNHRAWSHRQWVFHIYGKDWDDEVELDFCGEIIAKNPYNNFAWDQRHFMATRLLPKTYEDVGPMRYIKAVAKKIARLRERLQEIRGKEVDFALKIIVANPENQLPWGHISSLHNVDSTNEYFCFNVRLRHSILHVLEEARDSACCRLNDGSFTRLGDGSASVNNARGIINALNMFLEITFERHCSIMDEESVIPNLAADEGKRFKAVLDEFCPDSWFENCPNKEIGIVLKKIGVIVENMEIVLSDGGRLLRHATDQLLTRFGYFALQSNYLKL